MEEHKVHVGSLSYSTDEDSLKNFFEEKIEIEVVDGKWFCEGKQSQSLEVENQKLSKAKETSSSKLQYLVVRSDVEGSAKTSGHFKVFFSSRGCVLLSNGIASWIA